jgi:translation elongation factor EF-1beta
MKNIIDPITGEKYKVKKIIQRKHCTINVLYDDDDINDDKLNENIAKLLFNQAIVKNHENN